MCPPALSPLLPAAEAVVRDADGNHTPGTATRLTPEGTVVQANLTSPADVDYYVFTAQTGAQYVIETFDLAEANDTHLGLLPGVRRLLAAGHRLAGDNRTVVPYATHRRRPGCPPNPDLPVDRGDQ